MSLPPTQPEHPPRPGPAGQASTSAGRSDTPMPGTVVFLPLQVAHSRNRTPRVSLPPASGDIPVSTTCSRYSPAIPAEGVGWPSGQPLECLACLSSDPPGIPRPRPYYSHRPLYHACTSQYRSGRAPLSPTPFPRYQGRQSLAQSGIRAAFEIYPIGGVVAPLPWWDWQRC